MAGRSAAPDFITAPELARRLGVKKVDTLGQWVEKGQLPPAWCWLGSKRAWRRTHNEAFVATGAWPRAAWKESGRADRR